VKKKLSRSKTGTGRKVWTAGRKGKGDNQVGATNRIGEKILTSPSPIKKYNILTKMVKT